VGWFGALTAMAFGFRRLGLWHYRASAIGLLSEKERANRDPGFEAWHRNKGTKPL
jgi:hypothetical protein